MRVVERRKHARFTFEAGEPAGVCGERTRQHFDRNVTSKLRIMCAVDLTHCSAADERPHLERSESSSG